MLKSSTWFLTSLLVILVKRSAAECSVQVARNFYTLCNHVDDFNGFNLTKIVTIEISTSLNKSQFGSVKLLYAQHVETLEIFSSINSFAKDALKNFINLKDLNIYNNNITILKSGIFKNLPKLKKLYLIDNNIKQLETGVFQNLTQLELLVIKDKTIKKIDIKCFQQLPSLKLLSIITTQAIENALNLDNIPNIEELYLSLKLNSFIALDHLNNTHKLKQLDLSHNKISIVTNNTLVGLSNLKILNLAHNSISKIEPKSFMVTPKLENLRLDNNQLKFIDINIFPEIGLPLVNYLRINRNKLMFISQQFLDRLPGLRFISIGGNPWKCPCLDLVLEQIIDKKIVQECDDKYFSGKHAACVLEDAGGNNCSATYNDSLAEYFGNIHTISFVESDNNCM